MITNEKPKEIVLVTFYIGNGGAERVFSELANYWVNNGIEVTIVQTRTFLGNIEYKINKRIQIENIEFSKGCFRRSKQIIDFVRLMRKKQNSVIIGFLPQTVLLTGIASLFLKNMLILSERNDPKRSPGKKLLRTGRDILFELGDKFVFQTNEAKEHFSKRIQRKSYVIPNPINPNLPEPFQGVRNKTVIAAARLEKQKNLPMLINAFSLFHESHPDYSLEIYGRGPLESELHELISDKGIQNNARLMGFSDDIYSKMRDCAMYVSSSDYEGISNSMIEALGLGLPTICTDCPCGGARETITDGVNGILVPVGDAQALYEAMCRIVDDPEFAEKLSQNAIKIRDELSVDKIANQWLEIMGL